MKLQEMAFDFLKKFWLSITLYVAILYLCMMNTQSLPEVSMTNFDKLVHFLMFSSLTLILYFELTNRLKNRISIQKIIGLAFLIPTLYGGLIEILQECFSPTRSGDLLDFVWDTIGAFFGLIVCLGINKKLK